MFTYINNLAIFLLYYFFPPCGRNGVFIMDHSLYNEIPTKKYVVNADSVWEIHHETSSLYSNSHAYECPECHTAMYIVGLDNESPKRIYFKTFPGNPHNNDCTEESKDYLRNEEQNLYSNSEDGIISHDNATLVFKQRNRVKPVESIVQDDDSEIIKHPHSKSLNYLEPEEYHRRRYTSFSLHRVWLAIENAKTNNQNWRNILVDFDWKHYDKNDDIVDYLPGLVGKSLKLGNVAYDIQSDDILEGNSDKIFFGYFNASQVNDERFGTLIQLDFGDNKHFVRWSERRLHGLPNINILRSAANSNSKILIMICGHFFQTKNGPGFYTRTKHLSDFITIPDQN